MIKKQLKVTSLIFRLYLLLGLRVSAQNKNHGIENKELLKKLKIADALVKEKSYYNACSYYLTVLKGAPQNEYVLYQLGHSYFQIRDFVKATEYLGKIYEWKKEKTQLPLSIYFYAQSLKSIGQYPEAKKAFLLYSETKSKGKDEKYFRARVKNEVISCDFAMKMEDFDTINNIRIAPLPGKVNNGYSDFSPAKLGKDSLVFASIRSDSIITFDDDNFEAHPVKLFLSTKDEDEWGEPVEFKNINHPYDHTANAVYSQDKRIFYFTRCRPTKAGNQICSIYFSRREGNNWTKPRKLNKGINHRKYTSTQPSLGSVIKGTGKKKKEYLVLYFVSNRPGGKGSNDIWFSQMSDKGTFSKPVNCGPKVNTLGNETTPYFNTKSNTLYFSSDFHPNAGGFDVFRVQGSGNKWERAENLGMAINSSYDDTYFSPTGLDSLNFLVSNRPGSTVLSGHSCCEDIFEVALTVPPTRLVSGIVKPENKTKGNYLSGVSVGIIPKGTIKYHKKKYNHVRLIKDSIQWISNSDSVGYFNLNTKKTKNYSLILAKDSFDIAILSLDSAIALGNSLVVFLPDMKDTSMISFAQREAVKVIADTAKIATNGAIKSFASADKEVITAGEILILDKLTFDSDKDDLSKQSLPILESLYKFLKSKPGIKVEVAGHTDNVGSDTHNLDLSQRRANKIRDYLIKKGINRKMIVAKGYGETEPIAPNENLDGSDNPEGRRQNRRTEIRILEEKE